MKRSKSMFSHLKKWWPVLLIAVFFIIGSKAVEGGEE